MPNWAQAREEWKAMCRSDFDLKAKLEAYLEAHRRLAERAENWLALLTPCEQLVERVEDLHKC